MNHQCKQTKTKNKTDKESKLEGAEEDFSGLCEPSLLLIILTIQRC